MRSLGMAVLFLALCHGQVFAQVKLVQKYQPGTKSVTETDVKTNQTLTLGGMNIDTKSSTFSLATQTVGQRADDGSLTVVEKIDVLQTEVDLPGGIKVQFDSANPDKKADIPQLEPLMERLRVTFKSPVTTILDEMNKIKELKFPEGLADTLNDANKGLFDAAKRKKTMQQALGYLPDDAVKVGDSWERSVDAELGEGQTMAFRVKYTYEGTVEQDGKTFDKISAKAFEVSYSVDQSAAIRVSKSDLKITESNETILFDREGGFVQQKAEKVRIEGPLTLIFNGAELEGKVDLTIEHKSKRQK